MSTLVRSASGRTAASLSTSTVTASTSRPNRARTSSSLAGLRPAMASLVEAGALAAR